MPQVTVNHRSPQSRLGSSKICSEKDQQWTDACQEFMVSVPSDLQSKVDRSLKSLHAGGFGLRTWVASIAWRGAKLPEAVPTELLQVYLDDPEAVPLHECETCGIAIPVRPNRLHAADDEPEQTYFQCCPACGGRTGLYLFVSRRLELQPVSDALRRTKPR